MRLEIGAPQGWVVSTVRQRTLTEDDEQVHRAILQMQTREEYCPYRLAIADALDGESMTIRIDYICSEGFTTYCERSFEQLPTEQDIDQFAEDYGF